MFARPVIALRHGDYAAKATRARGKGWSPLIKWNNEDCAAYGGDTRIDRICKRLNCRAREEWMLARRQCLHFLDKFFIEMALFSRGFLDAFGSGFPCDWSNSPKMIGQFLAVEIQASLLIL